MTTTKHTAHWTLEALAHAGVKTIVFSPGSRNAPLIIAAEALGSFEMEVLGDERSAAFNALGRSLVTGLPVAVCCTSSNVQRGLHSVFPRPACERVHQNYQGFYIFP